MKDFGNLNSNFSTCTVCGSGNHRSLEHHWLNDAAREMYEALKDAEIMIGFLLEYAEKHPDFEKVSKRNANVTRCRIMDVIAKAEGGAQ